MRLDRIMGVETEYGILDTVNGLADLHESSAQVVEAYRKDTPYPGPRWDYSGESPLHDARGFQVAREYADPSLLTDDPTCHAPSGEDQQMSEGIAIDQQETARRPIQRAVLPTEVVRLTPWEERYQRGHNLALANGGRLYVDHSHPEYSTPEVTNPTSALIWDCAGEKMLAEAVRKHAPHLRLFKNNTDGKSASYGCHENYLVRRDVDFDTLQQVLIPFLVTRPIMVGAGRLGVGIGQVKSGFQISQRADFIDREVGLHTTVNRPIINTRDEPHADPQRWRRLHVIVGDANRSPVSTWLKLAVTSLVLNVLEDHPEAAAAWLRLKLDDPVSDVRTVSYDLLGQQKLTLQDGRSLTAVQIQREYWRTCLEIHESDLLSNATWEAQKEFGTPGFLLSAGDGCDPCSAGMSPEPGDPVRQALNLWDQILSALEESASDETERLAQLTKISPLVEWVARWQLLHALKTRRGIQWDDPLLAALDLQWSEITGKGGLAGALLDNGQLVGYQKWVESEQIVKAQNYPPLNTRAWFRGTLIREFPQAVTAASWHSIVLDDQAQYLKRLPLTEVTEWTKVSSEKPILQAIDYRDQLLGQFKEVKPETERQDGSNADTADAAVVSEDDGAFAAVETTSGPLTLGKIVQVIPGSTGVEQTVNPQLQAQSKAMQLVTAAFAKETRAHAAQTYGNQWY